MYLLLFYVVIPYVLPFLVTLICACILYFAFFKNTRFKIWGALLGAVLLSSSLAIVDFWDFRRSIAYFKPYEITPNHIDLSPGKLLHLQEHNHAGITCDVECPWLSIPAFTEYMDTNLQYALKLGLNEDIKLTKHDLWHILERPDKSKPFPYKYLFVSSPTYYLPRYDGKKFDEYQDWHSDGKGVHMLVKIPENGVVDFADEHVLYRKFNVQKDQAYPLLWTTRYTAISPEISEIFSDLKSRIVTEN